ncbi:cell death abnormality protein 1-like [Liolophura sinensis]|uniref:cell death abnormality protein 1-like n=1 Tax=Liolophura sinensis TaxID=3198878 RepID=UPI0031592E20
MDCGHLGCRPGWSGPTCQKENIVYKAGTVESSSELSASNSDNLAFDGNLASVFRSDIEANPHVTVRATGYPYVIHTIKIYNGATDLNDLSGFEIYVSESSDFINSKLCYRDNTAIGKSQYVINCTQPLTGPYIKLLVPKNTSLAIRDMEVYRCGEYWFGIECDRLCNCRYAPTWCNGVTGACPYGCPDGRNGTDCYSECSAGRFGEECQGICHCKNIASCDIVDGTCDDQGCAAGFKGDNCQQACSYGEFGEHCEGKCHCKWGVDCNKETGQCVGDCQAGFKGDNCQEDCQIGNYGTNCAGVCHCKNLTSCNKVDGRCDALGCEAGYMGSYCNTECSAGRFGENCEYSCHCENIASCNHANGSCDSQGCADGFKGDSCQEECETGSYGRNCERICHCKNSASCNKVYGWCDTLGCEAGYHGFLCDRECSTGWFGEQCQYRCHCKKAISCNHVNGTCDEGGCATGYKGDNCQEETASIEGRPKYNEASSKGLLVGVCVLAGISFVVTLYAAIATVKGRGWYIRLQQEVRSRYGSAQVPRGERSSEIYENIH